MSNLKPHPWWASIFINPTCNHNIFHGEAKHVTQQQLRLLLSGLRGFSMDCGSLCEVLCSFWHAFWHFRQVKQFNKVFRYVLTFFKSFFGQNDVVKSMQWLFGCSWRACSECANISGCSFSETKIILVRFQEWIRAWDHSKNVSVSGVCFNIAALYVYDFV